MTSLSPPISLFNFTLGNTCRPPFTLVYEKLNNSLRETTPWEKKQGFLPLSNSPYVALQQIHDGLETSQAESVTSYLIYVDFPLNTPFFFKVYEI